METFFVPHLLLTGQTTGLKPVRLEPVHFNIILLADFVGCVPEEHRVR
jgi:hypothetical protein